MFALSALSPRSTQATPPSARTFHVRSAPTRETPPPPLVPRLDLLSEWCRCGAPQNKTPKDSTETEVTPKV